MSVTASFAIDTFTLTYAAGAHGTITGTTPADGRLRRERHRGDRGARHRLPLREVERQRQTANPRTDTNVTADMSVTASFAIDTFTLTYTAGAHGTLTGDDPQTVNYGADGTAGHGVPDTGYHFVNWSDDTTANPRTDTNVTADMNVTRQLRHRHLHPDLHRRRPRLAHAATPHRPSPTAADGTAVTAVPDTGYHFVQWSDGSTANPRTDTNVTADLSVTRQLRHQHLHPRPTPPAPTARSPATPRRRAPTAADGTAVTAVPDTGYHFVELERRRQHRQPAHRHQRDGRHHRHGQLRHRHLHPDLHRRRRRHDQRHEPADRRLRRPTAPPSRPCRTPATTSSSWSDGAPTEPAHRHQRDGQHQRHAPASPSTPSP